MNLKSHKGRKIAWSFSLGCFLAFIAGAVQGSASQGIGIPAAFRKSTGNAGAVTNATLLSSDAHQSTSVKASPQGVHVYGLRKFPYPYKAMLAISSDADHETLRKFNLVHEFINTKSMTPMGKGLGLDFADSFFMYNGSDLPKPVDWAKTPLSQELTYFQGTTGQPAEASVLNRYIHVGWIDTMHSFGDFSRTSRGQTLFRRQLAVQAIQALRFHHDVLTVWTDHGNSSNVDDFGAYGRSKFFRYQKGANPWSPDDIANLVIPYGVRFIWADLPSDHFGYYSIVYPKKLPDGRRVWAFWRYTNTGFVGHSPNWVWTVDDLNRELTIQHLMQIEDLHQYAIVAQHLSADNTLLPLPNSAIQALRLLANQYYLGNILVARTSRLLQYNVSQKYIRYHVVQDKRHAVIDITSIQDPVFGAHLPKIDEVRGITFYTSMPRRTRIEIGGRPVPRQLLQYNSADGFKQSIEIKWFKPDTRNYAVSSMNYLLHPMLQTAHSAAKPSL